MTTYNVELRKRNGVSYDDLLYVATHVNLVEGLLDGNSKILTGLMPFSVMGGLKLAGSVSKSGTYVSSANLSELVVAPTDIVISESLTDIVGEAPDASNWQMFVGHYYVASQELTFTETVDGEFDDATWDDGLTGSSITVENGDWIIVTGWDSVNTCLKFSIINNTYKLASSESAGVMSAADKIKLDAVEEEANKYIHPSYTERAIDTEGVQVADVVSSDSSGHVTAISKRTLPNANQTDPGVMSAADKTKLDGIEAEANKYIHHSQTAINIDTDTIDVIDTVTVDVEGHTTAITTRTLPSSSTTAKGVIELATLQEGKDGADSLRAITPATLDGVLDYALGLPIFVDLTTANAAAVADDNKDGSYAFVQVS